MARDYQKSRVYEWEDYEIHSRTKDCVPFNRLQSLVDYIWKDMGLQHPPQVKKLSKNATRVIAHANRMEIHAPEQGLQTTILIHEIAHSMTTVVDVGSAMHNGRWLGVYIELLAKYAGFDLEGLKASLRAYKLDYNKKGVTI